MTLSYKWDIFKDCPNGKLCWTGTILSLQTIHEWSGFLSRQPLIFRNTCAKMVSAKSIGQIPFPCR